MPTFKNTSQSVFQDGDLTVLPGESFSTDNEGRVTQMTTMYAWQFEEVKGKSTKAPHEDELKAHPENKDVREIRDHAFVSHDADGVQEKVEGESV